MPAQSHMKPGHILNTPQQPSSQESVGDPDGGLSVAPSDVDALLAALAPHLTLPDGRHAERECLHLE